MLDYRTSSRPSRAQRLSAFTSSDLDYFQNVASSIWLIYTPESPTLLLFIWIHRWRQLIPDKFTPDGSQPQVVPEARGIARAARCHLLRAPRLVRATPHAAHLYDTLVAAVVRFWPLLATWTQHSCGRSETAEDNDYVFCSHRQPNGHHLLFITFWRVSLKFNVNAFDDSWLTR